MDESLLNQTLQMLSASINQQSASSINNLNVPEFSGLPNEDIYDFMKRFKLATLTLSDGYRCLALNKALKGAATIWAKNNIKELMANSKWTEIKTALYKRFGSPDKVLRNREKLANMKFDERTSTLRSYIELYATTYKKAFHSHNESDAVRSLKLNLPGRIINGLNHLNDQWPDFTTFDDLFQLVERYETRIMPYEPTNESSGSLLTMESLQLMFRQFREMIRKDVEKEFSENQRL